MGARDDDGVRGGCGRMARELGPRVMAEAVRGEAPLPMTSPGVVVVVARKNGLLDRADGPRRSASRRPRACCSLRLPDRSIGFDEKIKALGDVNLNAIRFGGPSAHPNAAPVVSPDGASDPAATSATDAASPGELEGAPRIIGPRPHQPPSATSRWPSTTSASPTPPGPSLCSGGSASSRR